MNLKQTKSRGFTIVELLIVIVVIAILAAITIVAYNGIQNRAKTSAGQALANTIAKKAEAYNTLNSTYPTYCQFVLNVTTVTTNTPPAAGTTGAGSCAGNTSAGLEAKLDNVSNITPGAATAPGITQANANSGNVVAWVPCTGGVGGIVTYWDFTTGNTTGIRAGNIGAASLGTPTTNAAVSC
jgi:prepilin-type N-terminal cleavage/methylation domain-containing protein